MERYEALRILDDPETAPEALGRVVNEYPDLRPRVARHPAAPTDLLAWLAALRHPAVDVGLASRVPPYPTVSGTQVGTAAAPVGPPAPPEGAVHASGPPVPGSPGHDPRSLGYGPPGYGPGLPQGPVLSPPGSLPPSGTTTPPGVHAPHSDGPPPLNPWGPPPAPARSRRTRRVAVGVVAGVLGIVLGLVGLVLGFRPNSSPVAAGDVAVTADPEPGDPQDAAPGTDSSVGGPRTATASHDGIPFGADGAAGSLNPGAVEVAVYVDYQCPHCASFDEVNRDYLELARRAGDVTVVLHPVSILDRTSDSQASTRAASAVAFVAEHDPSAALELHELLLSEQPSPGLGGLTDAEIAALAERAGASRSTVTAIRVGTATELFGDWVATTTDAAIAASEGGFGTPTVHLGGELFSGDWSDPAALPAAVRAAVPSAA